MLLKGIDNELYRILKQYFNIYLTPINIKSIIGKWSDEYEDDEESPDDDEYGRIIDQWDESSSKTKWELVLGMSTIVLPNKVCEQSFYRFF